MLLDKEIMLTTIDNPYDPHTEYDKWSIWDVQNGYNSSEYLARIANIGFDEEFDPKTEERRQEAILEIVLMDATDMYTFV